MAQPGGPTSGFAVHLVMLYYAGRVCLSVCSRSLLKNQMSVLYFIVSAS